MGCEYLVNGEWVSKSQLKQILNNGLLDNLIVQNENFQIEGFIPDETKLEVRSTSVSDNVISAKELQKILIEEVTSREGYPLNMIEALELNEQGTDFKIPLWSSNYVDKFESLLTAIVSNKIIKHKMKGTSSVLGSEEGFKLKEGLSAEETQKAISELAIVTTSKFDPVVGLKPLRYDKTTNTLLPAQVFLPFRYRDNNGDLLDINDFTTTDENGRKLLNTELIPDKLLKLFGFRIPTQSQNSMSLVEVVGFIPNIQGDLMIAPKDFTIQMGSDFDVDKLYSYMYDHFYKDGKLHTNFLSDKKKIKELTVKLKKDLSVIKDELKLSRDDSKLLDKYIDDKLNSEEDLQKVSEYIKTSLSTTTKALTKELLDKVDDISNNLKILNKSYEASLQNKILDIHASVMTNPHPEVVQAITTKDGFGNLPSIAQTLTKGDINPNETILSETYQRTKYINANAGKTGVGVFSLDSTFTASVQGLNIVYSTFDGKTTNEIMAKGGIKLLESQNKVIFRFGSNTTKGNISNKNTVNKSNPTLKSKIIQVLQSAAVDNEKEQLMDKLNMNEKTFDAIRSLALFGFEENDIFGLINQPIVKEYLEKLEKSNSSLIDYVANADKIALDELQDKYDPTRRKAKTNDNVKEKLRDVSGDELIKLITTQVKAIEVADVKGATSDTNLQQLLLLDKFLEATEIGKDIKKLQSAINSTKGLPKNLIETTAKVDQINTIENSKFINANALLGTYTDEGVLENPTTLNGFASYYGTMFANQMFETFFPYNSEAFNVLYNEVVLHSNKSEVSLTKQTEIKKDLFRAMKAFLFASTDTGLYSDILVRERPRLLIDTPQNKALARIIKELSDKMWFRNNSFLRSLVTDINTNGELSRVFMEAAQGDNVDESKLYLDVISMLTDTTEIGVFNGITYTKSKLMRDLISYAYLEGAEQGAKQFLKYIPSNYLKLTELGDYLAGFPLSYENFGGKENKPKYNEPSRFIRQYFQNNPSKAVPVTTLDLTTKQTTFKNLETLELNKDALVKHKIEIVEEGEVKSVPPQFISAYDASISGKYALYEFDNQSRTYKKLPVVSDKYNFAQYSRNKQFVQPVQKSRKVNVTHIGNQKIHSYEAIEVAPEGFDPNIMRNDDALDKDSIATISINKDLKDGALIKDMLRQLLNSELLVGDDATKLLIKKYLDFEFPNLFSFKIVNEEKGSKGSYKVSAKQQVRQLTINKAKIGTPMQLANTLLHELTHVFSTELIAMYNKDPNSVTEKQREIITNLKNLQARYINSFSESENAAFVEYDRIYKKSKTEGEVLTDEETFILQDSENQSRFYGGIKLSEFVTMALTDESFQKHLNNVKDPKTGKSFWESITDLFRDLIQSFINVKINKDSILGEVIQQNLLLVDSSQTSSTTTTAISTTQLSTNVKKSVNTKEIDSLPQSNISDLFSNPEFMKNEFIPSDIDSFSDKGNKGFDPNDYNSMMEAFNTDEQLDTNDIQVTFNSLYGDNGSLLNIVVNNVEVGNIGYEVIGNKAIISGVELNKNYRGQGIGTTIYNTIGTSLAKQGITLQSGKLNENSKALWEKLVSKNEAVQITSNVYEYVAPSSNLENLENWSTFVQKVKDYKLNCR